MRRRAALFNRAAMLRRTGMLWTALALGAGAVGAQEPAWPRTAWQGAAEQQPAHPDYYAMPAAPAPPGAQQPIGFHGTPVPPPAMPAPGAPHAAPAGPGVFGPPPMIDGHWPRGGAIPPSQRFTNVWPNNMPCDPCMDCYMRCDGHFVRYDVLLFHVSEPDDVVIGDVGSERVEIIDGNPVLLTNSLRLNWDEWDINAAHRIEFGHICGQCGWLANFWWGEQDQSVHAQGVTTVYSDPQGYLPEYQVIYDDFTARNELRLFSTEWMAVRRADWATPMGGLDFYYGVRYLDIEDVFSASGASADIGSGAWAVDVDNRIIGPQIGGRWWTSYGRTTLGVESRVLLGANIQRAQLNGVLDMPSAPGETDSGPRSFVSVVDETEFAAVGEIRLDATYHAYDWLAFRVGYNALLVGGVSRAAGKVNYELPSLGLTDADSRETLFLSALSLGVELRH